ncbi:3-isopropylmalate dehydratase small subunit 1 [Planctomycetes bacterium Pan216]|uniref:3-isopropylmalate dehydratase small subunit n=1 Tax=Kolteria novifilia TaxID=2527975 RepID=A0A518AZC3_9BACT|nr:3-isopropylmalate dehydratase small subunit 1 [Planctomycetes bacterium Pan216]
MEPFRVHQGLVAPLDRAHVDTDQIIPKQFLKRIERTGFGQFCFFDWRYLDDNLTPNPAFVLNEPRYKGASILLARENFGCGSSREHAPWALSEYGFRVIIAPSYADIFYNNCFKNGMLPITLAHETVDDLFRRVHAKEGHRFTVDLTTNTIEVDDDHTLSFEVDDYRRKSLLEGLDEIGITLQSEEKISAFEAEYAG